MKNPLKTNVVRVGFVFSCCITLMEDMRDISLVKHLIGNTGVKLLMFIFHIRNLFCLIETFLGSNGYDYITVLVLSHDTILKKLLG